MLLSAFRSLFHPSLVPPTASAGRRPAPTQPSADALADMAVGQHCRVTRVTAPTNAPDWERWLSEIGFIPGEPATVTARSPWGDGALVVRIGSSNFALRPAEAACVSVTAIE